MSRTSYLENNKLSFIDSTGVITLSQVSVDADGNLIIVATNSIKLQYGSDEYFLPTTIPSSNSLLVSGPPGEESTLGWTVEPSKYLGSLYVINWTSNPISVTGSWYSIDWSPQLGLFASGALAQFSAQSIMTSPDGINWTSRLASPSQNWFAMTWSPQLGIFSAISSNDNGNGPYLTSSDGINWIAHGSGQTDVRGSAWSPELGIFCAVGNGTYSTSPDGINWTSGTLPSGQTNAEDICWSPELGIFCVVCDGGPDTQRIITSPDGTNWTLRNNLPGDNRYYGVTWASGMGLFCAVGGFGPDTQKIIVSPDGITWTGVAPAGFSTSDAVVYSPELNILVVLQYFDPLYTSRDGYTWTAQTAPFETYRRAAWSPQLGIFCAPTANNSALINVPPT